MSLFLKGKACVYNICTYIQNPCSALYYKAVWRALWQKLALIQRKLIEEKTLCLRIKLEY